MDRIEKLTEFLRENPDDSFVQHALALEHIKRNEDEQAQKLFEELLARDPDYVGSYYHLAKLFERAGSVDLAAVWYLKGMDTAKRLQQHHAYNELKSAYEELVLE